MARVSENRVTGKCASGRTEGVPHGPSKWVLNVKLSTRTFASGGKYSSNALETLLDELVLNSGKELMIRKQWLPAHSARQSHDFNDVNPEINRK